jgi:hypothetical protein
MTLPIRDSAELAVRLTDFEKDLPLNAPSKRTQADKVQRAAADPNRPGAKCKAPPGAFVPVVDHARC